LKIAIILGLALVFGGQAIAAQVDQQRIDQIFAAYNKNTPGCALGVIRNGAFIYRKAYGAASLELGAPLTTQSVFYMGSVSKQFTAASVVLAAEQGLVSLDDDIRKYIPELPDYGQPITLRQMLHHTSGFRDFLGLLQLSGRGVLDKYSTDELIDLIARQKALNFQPGTEYLYSNTNYFLLAEAIKRVSKKPFSVFADEYIFRPLGMTHTRFYDDSSVVLPERVAAYEPGRDGKFRMGWSTNYDIVGAGGLMSSVDDLLLWDDNFYKNRLGNDSFLGEMQTRGVLNDGRQIPYALGLDMGTYRGQPVVEHNGALMGYRSEFIRFPEQHFTVVCLCNLASADPTGFAHKVADVYLEKILAPIADQIKVAGPTTDIGRYVGKYLNPVSHAVISFATAGDRLALGQVPLRTIGDNRFETPAGTSVVFDTTAGAMRVTGSRGGEMIFSGERIAVNRISADSLAAYAGTYESSELDTSYKLAVDGDHLTLRNRWNPKLSLVPLVADQFDTGDFGTLVFRRDGNGRILGMSLFVDRIRNITFEKTH
jgi:CubicO group peptidase (beta-lactamase class C family)